MGRIIVWRRKIKYGVQTISYNEDGSGLYLLRSKDGAIRTRVEIPVHKMSDWLKSAARVSNGQPR